MFGGTVEFDEAYIGGSPARSRELGVSRGFTTMTPITGFAQRGENGGHGKARATVADGKARAEDFVGHVETKVLPGSTVYTDDAGAYRDIEQMGYKHRRVAHSQKVYVSGDVHTNTIEDSGRW